MFPKFKRTVNKALLKEYHAMPCLACGRRPAVPAHVKSKGSGGPDEPFNLIPLCNRCHIETQHRHGWMYFLKRFPHVKDHLESFGWEVHDSHGVAKLWHPNLQRNA